MNEKVAEVSEHRRSIVITRRVTRGCETAYEVLLTGLLEEAKSFLGFEGGKVLRPQGADGLEYQVTLHFENRQAEERWISFEERHRWIDAMKALEDTSATTMLTGLETWFTLPAENHRKVAPKYKATFVVWTAVFPTVLIVSALLSQLPFQMPLFLSVFVITAISVPVAVYLLLPRLCRLLDPWVYRESKATRGTKQDPSSKIKKKLSIHRESPTAGFPSDFDGGAGR